MCDLRNEYSNLCRVLESLLHDAMMIHAHTSRRGNAAGHNISFESSTKWKSGFIEALISRIPSPINHFTFKQSIYDAVNKVYAQCLVSAHQFAQEWATGKMDHRAYIQRSQREFVEMRRLLDKEMYCLLGDFFHQAMWDSECISIPMLFKIDIDRKSRSYQDEMSFVASGKDPDNPNLPESDSDESV